MSETCNNECVKSEQNIDELEFEVTTVGGRISCTYGYIDT